MRLVQPSSRHVEEAKVGRDVSEAPGLVRRNHEGVCGPDLARAAKFESRRTFEHEAEYQLALMRLESHGCCFRRADRAHLGKAASRLANGGFLHLAAIEECPGSFRSKMMKEALASEHPLRIPAVGKFEPMFSKSGVKGRRTDLYDLETRRTLQHLMPDFRRLQYDIAFVHYERLALVFVDNPHPATPNIDHLQRDPVKMHPVCDRSALRNGDMRSDVAATEPTRDKVAIEHPGAALAGKRSSKGQHELRRERRQEIRRPRRLRAASYPNTIAFPAERSGVRVIRRIDEVQAKALAAQIVDRDTKVAADDLALAQAFLAGFFGLGAALPSVFEVAFAADFLAALLAGSRFSGLATLGSRAF